MAFEKFLAGMGKEKAPEPPRAIQRGPGRPRKRPEDRHPRTPDRDRVGKDGRIKPECRKRKGAVVGNRHYAAKRATKKRRWKREYGKRKVSQAVWRQTLERRFSQCRSYHTRKHARTQFNGDLWQLAWPEFLLIWMTAPRIWEPHAEGGGQWVEARDRAGQMFRGGCYLSRLDPKLPWTKENCKVFRWGKPLS